MSKKYTTADIHAFHRSIRKFCPTTRSGDDEYHMTRLIQENWNKTVGPNDEVIIIGDVSFGRFRETQEFLDGLNGRLTLVLGNHDNPTKMKALDRFEEITHYKETSHMGERIVFFHYPIFEWNQIHRGAIHLYGHVHGRKLSMPEGRCRDVGMDTGNNMTPYLLDDIVKEMLQKPIRCHH